ncbi:hypothetical protein R1sor_004070 [Riccia sorocarpa]|uniref:Protein DETOXIFICATION n=1 Tax=Riccia sorocarpa TaxID=122646 RepID=A0ABD3H458_9MARC
MFLLTLISIPISFAWGKIGSILVFAGQDPSLFAYAVLQPLIKFLQTQSAVKAMAVLSAITLMMHVPLCYFVIYTLGKTWTGFTTEAFQDVYLFFKVAFPSAVMTCLEYWCFDLLILLSGLLPNPQLETSSLSICASVSTRVSNKLGSGLPSAAKAAVKLTISMALIQGVVVGCLLLSPRDIFPYLFSSEPDVVSYVSSMVPLLSVIAILDGCQNTLSGVARGCRWQHLGAYSNLGAFCGVGLPVSLLLTFRFHLRGYGLWGGIIAGEMTQILLLSFITCTLNWQKLADEAAQRVHGSKEHLHGALPRTVT